MKKIFSIFFIFIYLIPSAQTNLLIYGKTFGFKDGIKITIESQIPLNTVFSYKKIIDTSILKDNKFSFNLLLDHPQMLILSTSEKSNFKRIFLQPGIANLVIIDTLLNDVQITSNNAQADYLSFNRALKIVKKPLKLIELQNRYKEVNNNYSKISQQISDTIQIFEDSLDKVKSEVAIRWINKNRNSTLVSYILYNYVKGLQPDTKIGDLLSKSSSENLKNLYGVELSYYLNKLSIGKTIPDLILKDTLGKEWVFSDFKGEFLLIEFWASWCGPCSELKPELMKLQEQFKNKKFRILGVSVDFNKAKWTAALNKEQYPWLQVANFDNNKAAINYGFELIPFNYLLNDKGVIVAKNIWGAELQNILTAQLNLKSK